jgi:hypothetical protein
MVTKLQSFLESHVTLTDLVGNGQFCENLKTEHQKITAVIAITEKVREKQKFKKMHFLP